MNNSTKLSAMNFLNEVAGRYPNAISLASGRPAERFFEVDRWLEGFPKFVTHFSQSRNLSDAAASRLIAQYGRTNGIIGDLIAAQIGNDEKITSEQNHVVVTTGCQEAIDLCLKALCPAPDDVVLVRNPAYIGMAGAAHQNGVEVCPFNVAPGMEIANAIRNSLDQLRKQGKQARALYLVPDFDNPTGTVMSEQERIDILALCSAERVVILEDNPYGMFRFDGKPVPVMFSLDQAGCVIYLGTYSKTLSPAFRVGFAVVPPTLFGDVGQAAALVGALSQLKSFTSVNTSQFTQALVGEILLAENLSLRSRIEPSRLSYRANRDAMLATLSECLEGVDAQWNIPEGGFFLTVKLPFTFGEREVELCATDYGVLVMPLSFFAFDDSVNCMVRLAFSNATPQEITEGTSRFCRFIRDYFSHTMHSA